MTGLGHLSKKTGGASGVHTRFSAPTGHPQRSTEAGPPTGRQVPYTSRNPHAEHPRPDHPTTVSPRGVDVGGRVLVTSCFG